MEIEERGEKPIRRPCAKRSCPLTAACFNGKKLKKRSIASVLLLCKCVNTG